MSISIAEQFVPVPGGSVFVRSWTPATAFARAPLILIHDSLGCVELWRDFPEELALRLHRPVIAYDRLGFGRSTPRTSLPSTDFITEEADLFFPAIRSALKIAGFSLFGHSVGGGMALIIAARHPACELVVTESAQAFVEERTREGILAARELFSRPEQFARLTKWHGDKTQWVLDAWIKTWLLPAFANWSLDPYLGSVHCPVLAIHGDRDEYGSLAFPTRIVQGVAGPSQLAIMETCGHVPHREQQEQVLQLVADFVATSLAATEEPGGR